MREAKVLGIVGSPRRDGNTAKLMAEALEHEIDHLDGRLYIDHVQSEDKLHRVKHPVTLERGLIEPGR